MTQFKKIIIYNSIPVFLIMLITTDVIAQEVIVPNGIAYKYSSKEINEKAKKILTDQFTHEEGERLFEKSCIVGPKLWSKLSKRKIFQSMGGKNVKMTLPIYQGSQIIGYDTLPGKLIQNQKDFKVLWSHISREYKSKQMQVRKLTSAELVNFWSTIFYDIEEPLFLVEGSKSNLVVDMSLTYKVQWIDELDR